MLVDELPTQNDRTIFENTERNQQTMLTNYRVATSTVVMQTNHSINDEPKHRQETFSGELLEEKTGTNSNPDNPDLVAAKPPGGNSFKTLAKALNDLVEAKYREVKETEFSRIADVRPVFSYS